MGLARIYPYTKFEVSSFTRFRFTGRGLKFNFWPLDPDYALLGVFCQRVCQCVYNVSLLQGEKPKNRSVSKNNTGRAALRAVPAGNKCKTTAVYTYVIGDMQ